MSVVAPIVVPRLPAVQLRDAIEAHDWLRATELLAEHQRELAEALAALDPTSMVREHWLDLLLAQRAMLGELHTARAKVMTALARLGEEHRGARAWLRELG